MLPLSALVKITSGLFLIKILQVLSREDNRGLISLLDNTEGRELISGIARLRMLSWVSILNLFVLHSMFFMNSITTFSFLLVGMEKFSPNCKRHWTSCGMLMLERFTNHLLRIVVREESSLWSRNSGEILISANELSCGSLDLEKENKGELCGTSS